MEGSTARLQGTAQRQAPGMPSAYSGMLVGAQGYADKYIKPTWNPFTGGEGSVITNPGQGPKSAGVQSMAIGSQAGQVPMPTTADYNFTGSFYSGASAGDAMAVQAMSDREAADRFNVLKLMPEACGTNEQCTGNLAADASQWSRYAPAKEAFAKYIQASGSSRLGMNTRNPSARITGINTSPFRPQPSVPLSVRQVDFLELGLASGPGF